MVVVPCSLLRTVQGYAADQAAITERSGTKTTSFGELAQLTRRFRRTLEQLGVESGDTVQCDLPMGADLAALLLASLTAGLHLEVVPGRASRAGSVATAAKLLVVRERLTTPDTRIRQVSVAGLGQSAAAWSLTELGDVMTTAAISVTTSAGTTTIDADAIARSVCNFSTAYPCVAGTRLVIGPTQLSVESILVSTVIPLALGFHAVLASDEATDRAWFADALTTADWCALDAHDLVGMTGLPASVQMVFCSNGRLRPIEWAHAEAVLKHPIQRGYGTPRTGFWAVCQPGVAGGGSRFAATIREMRSPLHLADAGTDCPSGEIILRPLSDDGAQVKTGDVGFITPAGELAVAGKLVDVSVRNGQATLLSDLDRLLASHPDICESRTFREHGVSPTEPAISVCATVLDEATLREWLVERVGPGVAPDRVVTLAPKSTGLPPVDTLRAIVTGQAGQAVVAALTARRFRRNPAHDEAGLAAAVDAALLSDGTLDFLMFWGCGPRRNAAAPDRAAVEALGDLLAAAEAAAPVRARAHVICTDLHATNNGHADSHFLTYFSEIRCLAAALDVQFELESAVWRRGGLTRAAVSALEQEPAFEARWQNFRLRDRFVHQASRHSRLDDKTAAARHYYATCLLERDVLKSMFGGHVFLTYNGPEFNECFPDLPTLYVYPGPRGRNDKPWFVDVAPQVAAE